MCSHNIINIPQQSSWIFWICYSIVLFIPDVFFVEAPGIRGYIVTLLFDFVFSLSLTFLVCFFVFWIGKISSVAYKILHIFLHLLIYSFTFVELFLYFQFDLRLNTFTFQLLNETNSTEVGGFIQMYVLNSTTFLLLCIVLAIFILEIVCLHLQSRCYHEERCKRIRIVGLSTKKFGFFFLCFGTIMMLATLSELRYFTSNMDWNYYNSDKLIRRNHFWQLHQSWLQYEKSEVELDQCVLSQQNVSIDSVTYRSSNIVLIIGETFNRHHSNLYGYPLNTNPKLSELKNLFVFNDVISTINSTTLSFKNFMSFNHIGDTIRWNQTPLFPALFKAAGYNVVFWSNQFVNEGNVDYFDASAGFFNHPGIAPHLFDYRNSKKFTFDGELIADYKRQRQAIERDSMNLIIFHLYGQHFPPEMRYPANMGKFTADDILRPTLTEQQRTEIALYDNATYYNDSIVAGIISMYENRDAIVIYFADHGEEINDFRAKRGRALDVEQAGGACLQCQLDVPLLIWMSEKYMDGHSDVLQQIESSLNRPWMTDDLPHLLLDLAGIYSRWFSPSRSVINAQFDSTRHRCIKEFDYDAICNGRPFEFVNF